MWVSLMIMVKLLIMVVVLMVMFSNQMDMNMMVMMGVSLIVWLESDKGGKKSGLMGEYGQLIMEYGMVATILSILAVFIMDSNKEKKGMEWVGLIFLATLDMIILVSVKDLLTVYLAMEAQSLAFYMGMLAMTMVFLLTPMIWLALVGWAMFIFLLALIISLMLALMVWAVILFGTGAVLADMNMEMLYLFAVSSWGAYAVLCSGWASNSSSFFLDVLSSPFDCVEVVSELVLGFHTEYSAVFFILFFLMSYFNVLLFWGGWLPIINMTPFSCIPEVVWLGIKIFFFLFLFIWTHASLLKMMFNNLMYLGWKSFLFLMPMTSKFNLLNLYWFSISKSNVVMQPTLIIIISAIIKTLFYFQLHLYCIHFVSFVFSIYTFFFQLSSLSTFLAIAIIPAYVFTPLTCISINSISLSSIFTLLLFLTSL